MLFDDLDVRISKAVAQEVAQARPQLEGLEDAVMARLAAQPARRPVWWRLRRRLAVPEFSARLAAAGVVTAALAVGFLLGWLVTPGPPGPLAQGQPGALFAVADLAAQSVAVVGEFSAWQPVPLSDADGDGIWTLVLDLPPGRYEYAFVVDGRWVGQDPSADEYVRAFGEYSSVRYIGGNT
ncbi:MAG: hypothetical protein ACP5G2_05305 [Candidatus Bipolaricaulaceae bacterium]